jgi:site-specific DNA-methyltransferase (adenine-specific)
MSNKNLIGQTHRASYATMAKRVDDDSVDLLFLDPYFNEWDQHYDVPTRCLKDDGVIVAFSNRPHTGRLQIELDKQLHFVTEVVWSFSDGRWISNTLPRVCHENILIYSASKKRRLNDMRLLTWIEKPRASKKGGQVIGKWKSPNRFYTPRDKAQVESVIYFPRNTRKTMGVVSKPLELIELLLQMTTGVGDLVFDPFCGSGTTAVACDNLERKYILSDIDIEAVEITKTRIRQQQMTLFPKIVEVENE